MARNSKGYDAESENKENISLWHKQLLITPVESIIY